MRPPPWQERRNDCYQHPRLPVLVLIRQQAIRMAANSSVCASGPDTRRFLDPSSIYLSLAKCSQTQVVPEMLWLPGTWHFSKRTSTKGLSWSHPSHAVVWADGLGRKRLQKRNCLKVNTLNVLFLTL